MKRNHGPLAVLEQQLQEACEGLWDRFVDPQDAFDDADGSHWLPLGGYESANAPRGVLFDEAQHREIRNQCRALAATNEFAINGHEKPVRKTLTRD